MQWILGFLLWWTFDDHLAEAVASPGLGALPWWVVFLGALALHFAASADIGERLKKIQERLEKKEK
jgi:hypothetical protein